MAVSSLDDILLRWREQSAASGYNQERVKGTAFEKLCMVYLTHDPIFPHAEATNRLICVTGRGETADFSCLMVRDIPNLDLIASGQFFPRWLYAKPDTEEDQLFARDGQTDAQGYVRHSAISDDALDVFRE